MKRMGVLVSALALAGCGDSIEAKLKTARSDLELYQQQLDSAKSTCAYGPARSVDDIREEALAEWDAVAGENLESVSPEQEWEIRKSLARELGLAPSEVDGWKDIYRSRAERAKRTIQRREETQKFDEDVRATEQQAACENVPGEQKAVELQKAEVARLERELKDSADAPGFFTYAGYGLVIIFSFGIVAWVAISIIDRRAKQRLPEELKQIRLDGLLKQAEIFLDDLPSERRQLILDAHAYRDLATLSALVRESAPSYLKEQIL